MDSLTRKWLAMFKEIAPYLKRVALVANPKTSPYDFFLRAARAEAPLLAIDIVPSPIETSVDIEAMIPSLTRMMNCGLAIAPDTTTSTHRALIITLGAVADQIPNSRQSNGCEGTRLDRTGRFAGCR